MIQERRRRKPKSESDIIFEDMIDSNKSNKAVPVRLQCRKLIESPKCRFPVDLINGTLTCIISAFYFYSTYEPHRFEKGQFDWFNYFSFLSHFYLFIEFILRMYVCKDIMASLLSMGSFLDFMTTFPYIVVHLSYGITSNDYDNAAVSLTKMFDTWRLFSLYKFLKYVEDEDNRKLLNNCHTIFCLVICYSALLDVVEDPNQPYHHTFFFVMTTISIIGYGHGMISTGVRITIICLIICGIIIVPSKAGEIVNLISKKSAYADYKYKIISKVPHVVIIGSVNSKNAINFFDEYFHSDHGKDETRHCIIIKSTRPDKKMESLIRNDKYLSKVHYIEGNPHEKKTFNRARLDKATHVVVMSNILTSDPAKEDANTILQAMVLKKYLKQHEHSKCQLRLQLLKPESIMHYELSLNKETKNDQIVCIENLKLSLLAKSCTTPGLISLISNLIKSCDDPPERNKLPKEREWEWLTEYWQGKSHEIYRVLIPKATLSKNFNELSNYIYKTYKNILFAIEIVEMDKESGPIVLNPGTFNHQILVTSKANFRYYGYIIADSLEEAEKIFNVADAINNEEADMYLNLGHIDDQLRKQDSDRRILDPKYESINISEESDAYEMEEEEENELDVENLEGDWVHFCHLTQSPVKFEDIKFPTLKDSKLAKDHIIICGIVENIRGFVIPLRTLHIRNLSPIVIFNEEEPSQQLWSQLSRFPQIYFVRGSALKESDLDRINLEDAKQVVILSPMLGTKKTNESYSNIGKSKKPKQTQIETEDSMLKEDNKDEDAIKEKKEKEEENLMDAQTIFKYNIIKKRHNSVKIITELYSHENLAYLDDPTIYHVMNDYGYDQTPTFAAGQVYSSSLMDSLVCQACYNSALITVLRQLVIGEARKSFQKKNMMIFGKEFNKIKSSNLYHVKVPSNLVGENFGTLYKEFALEKQMIPLGLYRTDIIIKEKEQKSINYVVTNPAYDSPLRDSDYVFVLCHDDPEEIKITENDAIDIEEDLIMLPKNTSMSQKKNLYNSTKSNPSRKVSQTEKALLRKAEAASLNPNSSSLNSNNPRPAFTTNNNFYAKKAKQEFLEELGQLQTQISRMMTDIVSIHKDLNKKSTYMIKDISEDLEQVMEKVLGNGM
ncbi:unnamed protein product [Moneuplotes crassus]|uniref:Calcium-activated potassium channel BK alpha subunit domain-containing protein n=1 Tax=Euplotes crassus TaxID=5936 RepID=A0AAD1XHI4_EUPCR|nr:unnamed protein product [Moneuplotes crassus]